MDRERQSYAQNPDAELLALKPQADAISAICSALLVRVSAGEALVYAGQPCPTLRGVEAAEEAAAKV
jgi:hypothetical protein